MKPFRYIAEDAAGARHEGELSAASEEAARRQLTEQDLRVVELKPADGDSETPAPKLSQRESEDVVIAIAELSNSEMPLVEGLCAAADESASPRVAKALRQIAAHVAQGFALENVLGERVKSLPPHVCGLIAAASRTSRMGVALDELVEHHRATREVWRRVFAAIAYPIFVLGMTLLVLSFLPIFIVPQFKQMFEEFGLELPGITQAVIAFSDAILWLCQGPGLWIVATLGSVLVVLMTLACLGIGTPATHRVTTTMPLVGVIWHWSGTAAFSRLLATMLEYDIPLPEALLLARDGVRDPEIQAVAASLARGVEQGRTLSELLVESNRLPASITPFVRWGERTGKLPEALRAVTDMLLQRVQMRTLLLRSIAPPVAFILVGLLVGFIIISLFMPLTFLIQGLSGSFRGSADPLRGIFGSIHLFVLIWIGVAVLWSLRLAYRKRGAVADDSIRLILTTAGWILILAGILGTAMQTFLFGAPLFWLVILAIVMMAVGRYRSAENRTLLWCLAAAAERGIPLEQAARAYSLERSDELGIRAARLAELLEGGVPLSLALAETRVRMPLDTMVAVRVGIETGDLGAALAKIAKYDDDADTLLRSIWEKVFYLVVMATVLLLILAFIMLKIVPVYAKMFEEFGLELPLMTQLLVAGSNYIVNFWFVLFPFFVWLPIFLLVGLLHYIGWLPRNLPLINWFVLRLDGGLVMRCLALSVKQQRPLPNMIWLLARLYPKWSVRKRLTCAGQALNNGEHWCQALRRAKLLRPSDVAVLTAAERSGNLEWALEEMADSSIRRLAYRLRLALNVLFPAFLFIFGMFIAFVVVSLFMPLVSLIVGLS